MSGLVRDMSNLYFATSYVRLLKLSGYHHMCAFYTYQIFDHPRLRNVTYYLRLDTDSFILDPICYDPIERAHSHALSYAYVAASTDDPWLTEGLWKLVDSYATRIEGIDERMKANGFVWPDGRGVPEMMAESKFPTIYNNFEIVRLERFRQPDIQGWLKEVSSVPERFYKYRWGASNRFNCGDFRANVQSVHR
jgi:mannosyltransferase